MMRIIKTAFILLFLMFTGLPQSGHAQKIMEEYKKPMPVIEAIESQEFKSVTVEYGDVPLGDETLSYRIRVPKNWKEYDNFDSGHITLTSKVLAELARFYGPIQETGSRSQIKIQAINLEFQYSAEQWLLKYLLSYSYTIQGFKVYDRRHAEALYVVIDQDVEYIVRTAVQINGQHVVLAQYMMPTDYWDEEKQMQAEVIKSFLLTEEVEEYAEPMLLYQFLDVASFKYPESWELRAPPLRSLDRMDVEIYNVAPQSLEGHVAQEGRSKLLDGKMGIHLVSSYVSETLDSEIDNLKKDILDSGLVISDIMETRNDYNVHDLFELATVEVYKAGDSQDNLQEYELWLAIMASGEYYYFVTLLTPARDEDYFLWARNTQSFKLVLELMTPLGKDQLQEE